MEFKVYDLSNAIDQFEKKLAEACIQFGTELPYQISEIIDKTRLELTQVKSEFEIATKSQSILENEILDTRIDLARQEDRVGEIGSGIKQVEKESIVASQKENELVANVSKILKTHYPPELERENYYEIRKDLEIYLEKTKYAHKEQLRKMWTLQEDIHLIEEGDKIGSYIPNSDLLKVKQLLNAHRIESMYGSEYLHQLSHDEKQYELERNPALRYSIVILEESFESLNLSFIEQELIRSHVVLVDKTKSSKKDKQSTTNPFLNKQDEMNYLFKDLSYSFLEDEYEFEQWKVMVEKNADDADHEVGAFERKIEQIEKVSKELEVLLSGILKVELSLKLLNLQTEEKKTNEYFI
ncbi:hypothetical protein [Bacillus coahuilensis]|uniref:hypothetical protein n=1 Tax=Bacillus coahuilensis TaxID=408580 RepID=UPI000185071B|nr:hypothetical protein [Bacillus coahuilensis]